ncbi:MAG: TrpR-like protein, YerC/YecD [Oscillospiraceae bacterium]|jgi:TrpR-related protein YerC/YecD|nr:TrpR-like protein, YerC/YecD [Oscillospiraceae bacterium]
MSAKLENPRLDRLFEAILSLKSREECYAFFEDLCTVTELEALQQRFQVAGLLHTGRLYAAIAAETGASTATISRVNRSLLYGSDGYKTVLERLGS